MTEHEREIETPDGPMPLFAAWPEGSDRVPGVIVYMDIFGLRDEIFDFARRFANRGYAAFVPDLFHRLPVSRFEPANAKGTGLRPEIVAAGDATTLDHGISDTAAILRYIDGSGDISVSQLGTVGYCMGGRHALAAAEAFPERVPAAASIHGGKLVNDSESSPHHLLQSCRGEVYFAFAKNDPTCPQAHQELLTTSLETGTASGAVKHFDAYHGWSFPTRWSYDEAVAEEVWQDLFALFERRLT